MSTKQYVGQKEVLTVAIAEATSPLGAPLVEVTYADGSRETMPERTLKRVATAEPKDLTALRDLRVLPVVGEILVLMREADLHHADVNYVIDRLVMSVNENFAQAENALWKVANADDRTFLACDAILRARTEPANEPPAAPANPEADDVPAA